MAHDETELGEIPVISWYDLCLYLGGSEDSFTSLLLQLIAKSDPGNRERLRGAYPHEVYAYELWMVSQGLTRHDFDAYLMVMAEVTRRSTSRRIGRGWHLPQWLDTYAQRLSGIYRTAPWRR